MYLLTEQDLSADDVRSSVADTDGILQVVARGDDWAEIIDLLTMYPDARRRIVRLLGEIAASGMPQ